MSRKAAVSINHAIDLYMGELARRGKSEETRRHYRWLLDKFAGTYEHLAPREVTADHCRLFLDRWAHRSPSTLATRISTLRGFFEFLRDENLVAVSPMDRIKRPPRQRPEELDVVTVSSADVRRIFDGCDTWQELLCIACLIYLGPRRNAVSMLRRRDADLERGLMRFREKGRKVIVKPIPDELQTILQAAEQAHVWESPDAYLVPNRRPHLVRRRGERANKVIYETVRKVAARAGVRSHVHALRAAFAVAFDEHHPDQVIALKELLGHSRIETTLVYLRRKDKQAAMETVRDLSWGGSLFQAHPAADTVRLEPALQADTRAEGDSAVIDAEHVLSPLQAKLRQLSLQAARKGRVR